MDARADLAALLANWPAQDVVHTSAQAQAGGAASTTRRGIFEVTSIDAFGNVLQTVEYALFYAGQDWTAARGDEFIIDSKTYRAREAGKPDSPDALLWIVPLTLVI